MKARQSEKLLVAFHLIVLCLVITLIGMLASKEFGLLEWPDTRKAHEENAERYRNSQRNVSDSFLLSGEVAGDIEDGRSNKQPQKENGTPNQLFEESEKDRLDIYAQEGMWRAANYLLVTTILTAVLSGFALYFIFRTFRTQSDELSETKKANALQLKPYFEITKIEIGLTKGESIKTASNQMKIWAHFTLENIGKSEASNFGGLLVERGQVTLQRYLSTADGKRLWLRFNDWTFIDRSLWASGTTISPNEKIRLSFSGDLFGSENIDISAYQNDLAALEKDFEFTYFFRGYFTYTDVVSESRKKPKIRVCEFALNRLLNVIDTPMHGEFGEPAGRIIKCKTIGYKEKPTDYEPKTN